MRSVAKHSYVKGRSGKQRMKAHVNYIQYRHGDDRENKQPRQFFSADRDGIQGREVKQNIEEIERGRLVAHKLILSPGLQDVDLQAYTRAVLQEVGRQKGLDLDWRAVIHKNTAHDHAHVIVFGRDENGREVYFEKEDYARLREAGDRYLERNHFYERFLERDTDRVMQTGYERDRGDNLFESLIKDLHRVEEPEREPKDKERPIREWDKDKAIAHLRDDEKIEAGGHVYTKFSELQELLELDERLQSGIERRLQKDDYQQLWGWIGTKEKAGDDYYEREAKHKWDEKEKKRRGTGEDEREFEKLDKDLRKSFKELEGSEPFGKGHKQHLREAQGRLASEHGHYAASMQIQQLQDLIKQFPERKEELEQQIADLRNLDAEQLPQLEGKFKDFDDKWKGFDELLGENWHGLGRGKDKEKDQASVQMTGERQLENEQLRLEQENQSGDQSDKQDRDRDEDAFARGEF